MGFKGVAATEPIVFLKLVALSIRAHLISVLERIFMTPNSRFQLPGNSVIYSDWARTLSSEVPLPVIKNSYTCLYSGFYKCFPEQR